MRGQREPSRERLVLKVEPGEPADEVARRAREIGDTEPVAERRGLMLLHLREPGADPKESWEAAQRALPPAVQVAPVLTDEAGHESLPTGYIEVRFHELLDDRALEAFADEHHLRLRARNRWIAAQAEFEVDDPASCYLPDLLEELEACEEVLRAWPETLARFSRR